MLLERELELSALRKVLSGADTGKGALLLIHGEPGAGNTALLRELAKLAAGSDACLLRSGGAQSERDFPLGVVRQLVLPLVAERAEATPAASWPVIDAVSGGIGMNPGDELPIGVLASVLHGLHAMLADLSAERTVLLLVDDLRWVDVASLRALAFLAARLEGMRVIIAAVLQDEECTRDPLIREIVGAATHRLYAEPLSEEATEALVADRFGAGCDDEFAAACYEITGGSPKGLGVLLDRVLTERLSGSAADVPRVRELGLNFRRERLFFLLRRDPAVEAFAKAVVVLAGQATDPLVARLSGLTREECAAARSVLSKAGQLNETGRHAMHDPELARAIAESLGAEESSRLHRAAAVLLDECGASPEEIVVPLLHVDALHDPWEIDQLRAAAVAARTRNAPETAVRYLRRALLDLSADGRARADLLVDLAAAELAAVDSDGDGVRAERASAVRHLAQAAGLMPDQRSRAEVMSWTPLHLAGSDPRIADIVREVADRFGDPSALHGPDRDLALRLEARVRYASVRDAEVLASSGHRLTELGPDAAPVGAAERELRVVLLQAATLNGRVGHRDVARMAHQLLDHEPVNSVQLSSALQILPTVLLAADAGDAASSWFEAALNHARRQRTRADRALVEAQRGLILLARGDIAMARECGLRGTELADPESPETMLMPALVLGAVALAVRDHTLARRTLEITESCDDLRMFALRRALRAELAAARGDLLGALAQALDCGRLLDRAGWRNPAISTWQVSAALLHHRLGQHAEAAELAEDNYRRALAWGAPTSLGRALRVRGAVTEGRRGIELQRQAVDVLQDAGCSLELSRTLVVLGKRLQSSAPEEGEQLLARGRRLAEQLQSPGAAEREDRGRHRTVIPVACAVARSVLTRAETTVAELAARGRSNQEIADGLEISRRAVEKHLTSSYRKLGIADRAALAAILGFPVRGTGGGYPENYSGAGRLVGK